MKVKLVTNKEYPELKKLRDAFEISDKGEICLAVGGDGMLVKAAKEFDGPILPVRSNLPGSAGYYADLCLDDIDFIVDNLGKKKYTVETLENKIVITYKGKRYYASNEAVLRNKLQEVNFRIYELSKGRRVKVYPYVMGGDGLLVTGVMGSTAYNKSAGGPVILSPKVICMTFLNADGPYRNPIVIDAERTIEVEIVKYTGELEYDGEEIGALEPGMSFTATLSDKELRIVRFPSKKEDMSSKLDRIIRSRLAR